jgi:hypothetical protein
MAPGMTQIGTMPQATAGTAWWVSGPTRSGKTHRLIQGLANWGTTLEPALSAGALVLVFAANGDNRLGLAERIGNELQGRVPVVTTTPAGFIQDEVVLFWPLLVAQLAPLGKVRSHFPLKLRPETEQELALARWQPKIDAGILGIEGWPEAELVRHSLDFLQLAAAAGIPGEDIGPMLQDGMPPNRAEPEQWQALAEALLAWRDDCLHHGLLSYGVMTELYWRYLLPHPQYQRQLRQRYCGLLMDDVDEYPAIARHWAEVFLDAEIPCGFTANPEGQVRLGLGADFDYWRELQHRCQQVEPLLPPQNTLAYAWAETLVGWLQDPSSLPQLADPFFAIQTTTRGQLLRQTAETLAAAIHQGQVEADEVAIIAPGIDAIARYSLIEILQERGIAVSPLNDQRPLNSSALVRSLLTLLGLVYPGLGRLVSRDDVAEMLVVLSQAAETSPSSVPQSWMERVRIDPVRAELIVDHCFVSDVAAPKLLSADHFPRWDRLGHAASQAYSEILDWLDQQQQQQQQRLLNTPMMLLDRAIQHFFWRTSALPTDHLATLRELMETADHFWQVSQRRQIPLNRRPDPSPSADLSESPVGLFIQMLRRGTVSANPYPARPLNPHRGVTLSTIFQYRAQRLSHRWQLWLDAGSPRWLTGTAALVGSPLFLQGWSGRPWTTADEEAANEARLARVVRDLLGRATERVYLCHSDLSTNGQDQMGPLLTWVAATVNPIEDALTPTVLEV